MAHHELPLDIEICAIFVRTGPYKGVWSKDPFSYAGYADETHTRYADKQTWAKLMLLVMAGEAIPVPVRVMS